MASAPQHFKQLLMHGLDEAFAAGALLALFALLVVVRVLRPAATSEEDFDMNVSVEV